MKLFRALLQRSTGTWGSGDHLQRFQSLSSDFWWRSDLGYPLRALNDLRVPLVRDAAADFANSSSSSSSSKSDNDTELRRRPLSGVRIADVGAGAGIMSEALARLGAHVTAVDPVEASIELARQRLAQRPELSDRLSYACLSAVDLSSRPEHVGAFDVAVASEVLEHVQDVEATLQALRALLKPNARLVITTINQTLAARVAAITLAERVLHLAPPGTHTYNLLVPKDSLLIMLQEMGFAVKAVHGMFYNPLTGRWSWTACTAINYAVVAQKL